MSRNSWGSSCAGRESATLSWPSPRSMTFSYASRVRDRSVQTMHKVLMIALRDYKAAVRSKSFLASLLMMPVLMFGGAAVQIFMDKRPDIQDKKFAVVDRT